VGGSGDYFGQQWRSEIFCLPQPHSRSYPISINEFHAYGLEHAADDLIIDLGEPPRAAAEERQHQRLTGGPPAEILDVARKTLTPQDAQRWMLTACEALGGASPSRRRSVDS
jgi:hypothetical protein